MNLPSFSIPPDWADYILSQSITFVIFFIYGSFFEWALHRYFMHRKNIIPYPYERHALIHHKLFKADESFHALNEEMEGEVSFDARDYVFLILINTPLLFALELLTGLPIIIGGWLAGLAYIKMFNVVHNAFHMPGKLYMERMRWFKWLKRHHQLHHKYQDRNLNVVFPLADYVLGTRINEPLYNQKVAKL